MSVSRRSFMKVVGVGGVGALALPYISARGAEAAVLTGGAAPLGSPSGIRLDSNENPNGPGRAVLEAMHSAFDVANRYPGGPTAALVAEIAKGRGVTPANVIPTKGRICRSAPAVLADPHNHAAATTARARTVPGLVIGRKSTGTSGRTAIP